MRVLDPGHWFELASLDARPSDGAGTLRFVKRVGEKYPGNEPPAYGGTTTQEVLRALIARTHYVDAQDPHVANDAVIWWLRKSLTALERRAADRRGDGEFLNALLESAYYSRPRVEVESLPTCARCGHVGCRTHKETTP